MPRDLVLSRAELAVAIPPERLRQLGLDKPSRRKSIQGFDRDPEHASQCEFIAWTRNAATLREFPELDDVYAVPNFNLLGKKWGKYFNNEGRKRGQLDLVIPHGRGGYYAAYLETKAERGRLSAAQVARAHALARAGNKVYVCHSGDALKRAAREYLMMAVTRVTNGVSVAASRTGRIPSYTEADVTTYR